VTNAGPHDWCELDVPTNIVVGERSWLYSSFAFLHCRSTRPIGVRIGSDTGVYNGTMFELGPEGEVDVADYCTLAGPIIATNGRITIGSHALISFQTLLADRPVPVPPTSRAWPPGDVEAPSIVIGENVWIGARAAVLGGARIGEGSIVGAASVVDFEVPPYSIVAGNPARVLCAVTR
jgi:UDP-3-O-[3-hydroxymyristoyl] glucosamine N-acyltransferase